MSKDRNLSRRGFMRLCAATAALVGGNPALLAQEGGTARRYDRARLVDAKERALTPDDLKVGENYIFHYPFVATPCFLIDLGKPAEPVWLNTEDGRRYRWDGGIGPRRSLVAFSAICAHKMTHPAREVSFINYRHRPATFRDSDYRTAQQARVIYCCSEKSVYDATAGARVLGGPARQPLATVLLEQDERGELYAVGVAGGALFDAFFERFSSRLALELRTDDVRRPVTGSATVLPLDEYCRNQILC
jgi:Rieske Fe-S protein